MVSLSVFNPILPKMHPPQTFLYYYVEIEILVSSGVFFINFVNGVLSYFSVSHASHLICSLPSLKEHNALHTLILAGITFQLYFALT